MSGKGTPTGEPTIVKGEDMDQLWLKANNKILWAPRDELSYWSSLDTMISDCMGLAQSGEFTLNIGRDLWVTESRWNTLLRQYVHPERLFEWLEGVKYISTYNRGITAMDMNPVKRTVVESNPRANRRRWGGCMRMVTYRAFPQPTVTLFSRTSYLGYVGGLDMLVAHKLIEMAADMIGEGLKVSDFQFRWVCDTWQFHGFKSAAFIFASGQEKLMTRKAWPEEKLGPEDEYPTWKLVRNWWRRIMKQDAEEKPYAEMRYSAEKRIRRRYHGQQGVDQTPFLTDEKEYKPLDFPIHMITLDRMLYKTPESRAILKKKRVEKAEKLVDTLFGDDEIIGDLDEGVRVAGNAADFDALTEGVEELVD